MINYIMRLALQTVLSFIIIPLQNVFRLLSWSLNSAEPKRGPIFVHRQSLLLPLLVII